MLNNLKVKTMKSFWGDVIPILIVCLVISLLALFVNAVDPFMEASSNHPLDCVCELCEWVPHPSACECEACLDASYTAKEIVFMTIVCCSFFALWFVVFELFDEVLLYFKLFKFLENIAKYNAEHPECVLAVPERYKDLKALYNEKCEHVKLLHISSFVNKKSLE